MLLRASSADEPVDCCSPATVPVFSVRKPTQRPSYMSSILVMALSVLMFTTLDTADSRFFSFDASNMMFSVFEVFSA